MSEALIIVDVQNEYFHDGGKLPLSRPVETAEACAKLIKKFRDENKEVVFIKHVVRDEDAEKMPIFTKGTRGVEIHDIVKPLPTEKVIIKHEGSSFVRTDLKEHLNSKGVKNLIVVGMMVHNCVNATVYSAVDEGFKPIIVEEAVDTFDQQLNGKVIKAEDLKAAFLAGVQFLYSKVYSLEDVLNNNFTYEK